MFLPRYPAQRPRDLQVGCNFHCGVVLRAVPEMVEHVLCSLFIPGLKLVSGCWKFSGESPCREDLPAVPDHLAPPELERLLTGFRLGFIEINPRLLSATSEREWRDSAKASSERVDHFHYWCISYNTVILFIILAHTNRWHLCQEFQILFVFDWLKTFQNEGIPSTSPAEIYDVVILLNEIKTDGQQECREETDTMPWPHMGRFPYLVALDMNSREKKSHQSPTDFVDFYWIIGRFVT